MSGPLQPGAVFGKDFEILRELKEGGMGAVYVALQRSTGKQRALKVMARELATDPTIRERFVFEAKAASRIESDHVVEIVTAGIDEETGAPFLVMELLKGEELGDAVARLGPLPLGDVAEILAQIGHALEQAHANGIVHRDLKLENVFIATSKRRGSQFTAKILDFGIAKMVADSKGRTRGTQPLGTPLFMAPEQTDSSGKICPATDVWALGLIAFRLLAGKEFWREADGSLPALMREVVISPIPPASTRAQELGVAGRFPPRFDAWFARCVDRDVDARFQEAGGAIRAFAAFVPADAPRGMLVVKDYGASSPDVNVNASTVASTAADPSTPPSARSDVVRVPSGPAFVTGAGATARAPRRGALLPTVALGAIAVASSAGYLFWAAHRPPAPAQPPAMVNATQALPVTTMSAPVTPAKAPDRSKCPDGAVLLAGGRMFMGARDIKGMEDATPHEVTVSRFCLDKTEVTTAAYMACVAKNECERPPDKVSSPGLDDAAIKRFSPLCNAGADGRGDHPINCVAWAMADNYCAKAGRRLPTEAEWEFAARGKGQSKYPWGNDAPSARRLNACGTECAAWGKAHHDALPTMYDEDDGFPTTAPVGHFPDGASPDGILDLAGNVWEWTADWYGPYGASKETDPKGPTTGTLRVLRGGDYFGFQPDWARPAYRWKTDPGSFNHAIGFRCAADPT